MIKTVLLNTGTNCTLLLQALVSLIQNALPKRKQHILGATSMSGGRDGLTDMLLSPWDLCVIISVWLWLIPAACAAAAGKVSASE